MSCVPNIESDLIQQLLQEGLISEDLKVIGDIYPRINEMLNTYGIRPFDVVDEKLVIFSSVFNGGSLVDDALNNNAVTTDYTYNNETFETLTQLNDYLESHLRQPAQETPVRSTDSLNEFYDEYILPQSTLHVDRKGLMVRVKSYYAPDAELALKVLDRIHKSGQRVFFNRPSRFWNTLVRLEKAELVDGTYYYTGGRVTQEEFNIAYETTPAYKDEVIITFDSGDTVSTKPILAEQLNDSVDDLYPGVDTSVGLINDRSNIVEVRQIPDIPPFELFTDRDKLCSEGICNYTAKSATVHLRESGLNPYPELYDGTQLAVSVYSPVGPFTIGHYVSAVAINDSVFIYDMPQNEFISDSFFGMPSEVPLKNSFKPRLIPLTLDDIQSAYNLSVEQAGNFISSILNANKLSNHISFREYLAQTITDPDSYIALLEDSIVNSGYERVDWSVDMARREQARDLKRETFKAQPLTNEDQEKVANYYKNKLYLKTKAYLPRTEDKFSLATLIKSILGDNLVYSIDYSSFENALNSLKNYLSSEQFMMDHLTRYVKAEEDLAEIDEQITAVYSVKRLMESYVKQVKIYGLEQALTVFDEQQQFRIKRLLPADTMTRYASKEQAALLLSRYWSNKDNIVKALNLPFSKSFTDLTLKKFKALSKLNKYKTVLNYLKSNNFDTTFLYDTIYNEANRRYSYFEKQGNPQYQKVTDQESIVDPVPQQYLTEVLETLQAKFDVPYRIINDPSLRYKGRVTFESKPVVEINLAYATPDTPMHEYGHLLVGLLRQGNKQAYKSLLDEFDKRQDAQEIYQQVKIKYPDLSEAEQIEEAMVELVGRLATNKLDLETGLYKFARKIWTTIKEFLEFAFNVNIERDIEPNVSFDEMAILLADASIRLQTTNRSVSPTTPYSVTKSNEIFSQTIYLNQDIEDFKEKEKEAITELKKSFTNFTILNNKLIHIPTDVMDVYNENPNSILTQMTKLVDLSPGHSSFIEPKLIASEIIAYLYDIGRTAGYYGLPQEVFDKVKQIGLQSKPVVDDFIAMHVLSKRQALTDNDLIILNTIKNRLTKIQEDLEQLAEFKKNYSKQPSSLNLNTILYSFIEDAAYLIPSIDSNLSIGKILTMPPSKMFSDEFIYDIVTTKYGMLNSNALNAYKRQIKKTIILLKNTVLNDKPFTNLEVSDTNKIKDYVDFLSKINSLNFYTNDKPSGDYLIPKDDDFLAMLALVNVYQIIEPIGDYSFEQKDVKRKRVVPISTSTGVENYHIVAEYSVQKNSVDVGFSASSTGHSTTNDSRFFKVLPTVIKTVTEMMAGYNYDKITFYPIVNETDKSKNMRLRGYNIFARRLFGKYSVLGENEDQTTIPVPEVFQNRVAKEQYALITPDNPLPPLNVEGIENYKQSVNDVQPMNDFDLAYCYV